jgi:hypothetical protein
MGKAKSNPPKKEMSEGKAIALAVLLFTVGIIAAGYLIKLFISYFFPGLF